MYSLPDDAAGSGDHRFVVAAMCADWCRVCQAFEADWSAWSVGLVDPRIQGKLWVDLENTVPFLADLDVLTLPTLAIIRWSFLPRTEPGAGLTLLNLAPVPPSIPVVERITLSCLRDSTAVEPINTQPALGLIEQQACAQAILSLFRSSTATGSNSHDVSSAS